MTKIQTRRLDALEKKLLSIPIPPTAVRSAYGVFRATGVLPDDVRLAHAVIQRAKCGPRMADALESATTWGPILLAQMETPPRPDDPVMDALYDEATFGSGFVREAARVVLQSMAEVGLDPTEALYAGMDVAIPAFGGVGLQLAGFPKCLEKPPFEQQARGMMERVEAMRRAIPEGDRRWFEKFGEAILRFPKGGGWPEDPLTMDCILVLGELHSLMRHMGGEDVAEIMAAFHAAATTKGAARDAAIARVQDLAVVDSVA
jgi:hypothetical protein